MYRVKLGIFGQTANFGQQPYTKQHPSETPDVTAHKEPSHLD